MKKLAALAFVVLFAGCTSSDGFIDNRVMDCEHSEIMIRVGLEGPTVGMERIQDRLKIMIEVSNNSHSDIVVKFIRVEQLMTETAPFRFENSYRTFNQAVAEGEDHLFELPTIGSSGAFNQSQVRRARELAVSVSVGLESGDQYRCQFAVPAPV